MKDELQKRLISSLDKVQEYIEATEGFVAPLVAQEIIAYGKVCSVWTMLCLILVTLILGIISIYFWLLSRQHSPVSATRFDCVASSVLAGFASFCFGLAAICLVPLAMKPWIMPRLYLIQEIGKLL